MSKILVIDDEPGYLLNLRMILEGDGHQVETAETGDSALEIGGRFVPDVLLTDWKLKGRLTGLDVARKLRTGNARLVTIVMTGYLAESLNGDTADFPNLRILEKPFHSEAVKAVVRQTAALEAKEG